MSVIAGTAQHGIFAINLLGKKYPVPVEGKKGIFTLEEFLEVESVGNPDGRTVISITPGYPVPVLYISNPRVIFVIRLDHPCIACLHLNGLMINLPVDAILAEPGIDIHLHCFVVTAEYTRKSLPEGDYGTIEDAVGGGDLIPPDDRVPGIAPNYISRSLWSFFPGYFCHSSHRLENSKKKWLYLFV
jgi:hypothetical protein